MRDGRSCRFLTSLEERQKALLERVGMGFGVSQKNIEIFMKNGEIPLDNGESFLYYK